MERRKKVNQKPAISSTVTESPSVKGSCEEGLTGVEEEPPAVVEEVFKDTLVDFPDIGGNIPLDANKGSSGVKESGVKWSDQVDNENDFQSLAKDKWDEATRDLVLEAGVVHFDRKPVILRPWSTDLDAMRLVKSVLVWVRLPGLGLQYWGVKCLSALVSTIGNPILVDKVTKDRSMMQFTRVLVDVEITEENKLKNSYSALQDRIMEVTNLGLSTTRAFLETKLCGNKMEEMMASNFVLWNCYTGSASEGRILLVWQANIVSVEVLQESDQFIHTYVKDLGSDKEFSFDFDDCLGGRAITSMEMVDAQRWRSLGLVDELRTSGSHFTWMNKQAAETRIYSKLDRIFTNEAWMDLFPRSEAYVNWDVLSDHCFRETVLQSWSKPIKAHGLERIMRKLVRLKHVLRQFNRREIGDVVHKYAIAKGIYQSSQCQLQKDPHSADLQREERSAFEIFSSQSRYYESYLRQRSKINWLQFGDDNTAYFHACLKQRKATNRITSFIDDDGQINDKFEDVVAHFLNHFQSIMGSHSTTSAPIQRECFIHGGILSLDQQLSLMKPFTKKDVEAAMFSINSIKSSGPDGYGSGFFKVMWKDLGEEISDAILGFFDHGVLPAELNSTTLSLISKVDTPTKAVEYRPIACCNTLYKCISKMLCGRLTKVLSLLINQNQGAFVKDRLLAHNILIFQDIIKGYKRKNISPRYVMKIDLSKVYDTIDWQFLEDILNAYCFPSRFIPWVMIYLKGTSYTIFMNGRLQGSFIGRKGLRQGDPISPLLFVLVMEYLTRLLIQVSYRKDFRFHPNCKKLKLVCLCFADDLVLFCKGASSSVKIIKECFTSFSLASGLTANMAKSQVYGGGLTEEDSKNIVTRLQFAEGSFPLKYLGVPLRPTKWKAGDCALIIKKIHPKLHSWFLWGTNDSNSYRSKMHFTAWDQVCLPKSLGGIGFKEGSKWSRVLLAKFLWAITSKQDILWVKWVDAIYLKGQNFWEYKIKNDVSWYWRKLVNLKSIFSLGDLEDAVKNSKINLRRLYVQLLNKERVHFANVVWCNLEVPKHMFILWQDTLGHLLTRDKLVHCHMNIDSLLCPICELEQETHAHLFFDCLFSQQVRSKVTSWLGNDIWLIKYEDWSNWMIGRPKGLKQKIAAAALAA
ncbi:uncharacterized protein LOC133779554 [Humulus lupulus]|uniref:uncharacterized protein LOC133779554 n=1 Tax=Humulus lupulus TaxID=3486 RepID=UPI002B418478|nr:uncharacterized protein LOC133779554 [Humulus lupulus]